MTALVTGAAGALGQAIATRLAHDGYDLALTDIDDQGLKITAKLVEAQGRRVHAAVLDLRDSDALASFVATSSDALGPVEVLVNNAAIYPATPFLDTPLEQYDEVVAVNQRAYWIAAQGAARQMRDTGAGAIVNIASITMHGGWSDIAPYASTKGAAVAFTRALARELGPYGIRVNAVSPGAFPTAAEAINGDPEAYSRTVIERQALKRRGTPEELAAAVSFLAGPDASFVTGQCLEVNGGWVMQ